MNHYVCTECKNQSKSAGTCQTDDCVNQGSALQECKCEDGLHGSVIKEGDGDTPTEKPSKLIDFDNPTE